MPELITTLKTDPARFAEDIGDPEGLKRLEHSLTGNNGWPEHMERGGLPPHLPRIRLNEGTAIKTNGGRWLYQADENTSRLRHMPTWSEMTGEMSPDEEEEITNGEYRPLRGPADPAKHTEPKCRLNFGWFYMTETANAGGQSTGGDGSFYVPDKFPTRLYRFS